MTSKQVSIAIVANASGATGTFDKLGTSAKQAGTNMSSSFGAASAVLRATLGPALGGAMTAIDTTSNALGRLKGSSLTVGTAMTGVGAVTAGAGIALSSFGSGAKAADQQLSASFKNVGASTDDYKGKIDSLVNQFTKYGDSEEKTKDSLGQLTTATGSPTKAFGLMSTAADYAAAKHISLASATTMVANVYNGKGTRALTQFGITAIKTTNNAKLLTSAQEKAKTADEAVAKSKQALADKQTLLSGKSKITASDTIALNNAQQKVKDSTDKAAAAHDKLTTAQAANNDKTTAGQKNIDALGKALKGQASAASDTFNGKLEAMKTKLGNSIGQMGEKYGPAVTGLGAAMTIAGSATQMFSTMTAAKTVVQEADTVATDTAAESTSGGLITAIGAAIVATAAWIVELAAQAVAMIAANLPIIAIGVAIAAVIAIVVLLAMHWKQVWSEVKKVAGDVWHWLEDNVIHPVSGAFTTYIINPVKSAMSAVGSAWKTATSAISGAWTSIKGYIQTGMKFITDIPKKITGALKGVAGLMSRPFKSAFNMISDAWNHTVGGLSFKVPSWVPVIGGDKFAVPKLPRFASGGIMNGLGIINDAGPELWKPPQPGGSIIPAGQSAAMLANGGGGDTIIHVDVTVQGNVQSENDLVQAIRLGLNRLQTVSSRPILPGVA